MERPALKDSAEKQHLRQIFNSFAAKAAREFPHLSNSFLVYSPITDSFHGIGPADKELDARIRERLPEQVAERQKESEGLAGSMGYFGNVPFVVVLKADHHAYTPRDGAMENEVQRLLLHELGHHVAPGGRAQGAARGESIADTYAYLDDPTHADPEAHKDWKDLVLWQRTGAFVFMDIEKYFTTPVLEAAMDFCTRHPPGDLAPQEKANLAYRLAVLAQPDDAHLQALSGVFAPAREAMDISAQKGFEKLAEIMFADHGALTDEVYRIASTVLRPVLESKTDVLATRLEERDMKRLDFSGPQWDMVWMKMAARDQNMPGPKPLTTEANDMFLLGHFDRPAGSTPDPAAYESKENMNRVFRCYDTFAALRRFQKSGTPVPAGIENLLPQNVSGLSLTQTAELAARIVDAKPGKPKPALAPAASVAV